MAIKTQMIGPADRGRIMSWEEFQSCEAREGYRYELIDGRLVVAAAPNVRHSVSWDWLNFRFTVYRRGRPDIINHISPQARIFVPRPGVTVPEPDFAIYRDFPVADGLAEEIDWSQVSPFLVIEIISADTADKDLVRNVQLYEEVLGIQEYWIVDPRDGADQMTLRVYRRRGRRWQRPIDIGFGETYTTKLLPGFSLLIDPLA